MRASWSVSVKGNEYTEINGVHCVVGKDKYGRYFALVDDEFLQKKFLSIDEAKSAVCVQLGMKPKSTRLDELEAGQASDD